MFHCNTEIAERIKWWRDNIKHWKHRRQPRWCKSAKNRSTRKHSVQQ